MKTCVMCKFYPAAAGESICDDCVKTLPHLVSESETTVIETIPEKASEPKLDFHSALGGRPVRRLLHGRAFRNGRVA